MHKYYYTNPKLYGSEVSFIKKTTKVLNLLLIVDRDLTVQRKL